MTPLAEWGNVWGTSVTVPVTISTSCSYEMKKNYYLMNLYWDIYIDWKKRN